MNKIIEALDKYNQKVPVLPVKVKDIIVKIAPYLAIVGVILSCLGLLSVLAFLSSGYGAMMAVYAGAMPTANLYIALIFSIIIVIIYIVAIPGLFKRKKSAWNLMFYSQIVSVLSSLINFNLISLILGLLIGLYILFQVRSYYTQ